MDADLSSGQIRTNLLIVVQLEVDDAVLPERANSYTGLRVERDEPIPRGVVQDSFLGAVGPVGEPASRQLAWCGGSAPALMLSVNPQQLAGRGIERHDGAPCAGRRVQNAVDHQRRSFELVFRPRPQAIGLE